MAAKQITAKFDGMCQACKGAITPGEVILWESKNSRHLTCPAQPVLAAAKINVEAAPVCWSTSSQHRPAKDGMVGRTVRAPQRLSKGAELAGQVVTITAVRSRFIAEDGLSFGLDDDQGWLVTFYAAPASEADRRALEAREATERADADRRRREAEERAAAEKREIEDAQAKRREAIGNLVAGGGYGFTWTVVEGQLADVVSWRKDRHSWSISRGILKSGAPLVREVSHDFDDDRTAFWTTPAGIEYVFGVYLAEANRDAERLTPATAREWLSKYAQCHGAEFFRWLAARDGQPVEVPTGTAP